MSTSPSSSEPRRRLSFLHQSLLRANQPVSRSRYIFYRASALLSAAIGIPPDSNNRPTIMRFSPDGSPKTLVFGDF